MSFELSDKTLGLWIVDIPSGDFMAVANLHVEGVELAYRFRRIVDDKIFDSKDTKSWTRGIFSGDENEILDQIRGVMKLLADLPGAGDHHELLTRDYVTMDAFTEALFALPCIHVKTVTEEEAKAMGIDTDGAGH